MSSFLLNARPDVGGLLASSALETRKLHLGCGSNVLMGWTNVDIAAQPGVFPWDLSRRLPLPDGTIDLIYSEHFIEHISWEAGQALLRECRRLLGPAGALRLSTPNLEFMIGQYQQGRLVEWIDMGWVPQTACAMVNEGMRAWGHQYVYDREELYRALRLAGFSEIENFEWRKSGSDKLIGLESRPWHHELIVEARA